MLKELTLDEIAISFGVTPSELPSQCTRIASEANFFYRVLENTEKEDMIIRLLEEINFDTQVVGTDERKEVWQQGWQENLDAFRANKDDPSSLIPRLYKSRLAHKWNQQLIIPEDPELFEWNYTNILRRWILQKYGEGCANIYEFGCGVGINLTILSELFPESKIFASDFVDSSVLMIKEMAEYFNLNIESRIFDMVSPDYDYEILGNSCVFTLGALEQLAGKFYSFIDYLLHNKPSVCCHVEPVVELLDDNNLIDYLTIKHQNKRKYSNGLLPYLRKLDSNGTIELLEVRRLFFGNPHMEGYNILAWKPK